MSKRKEFRCTAQGAEKATTGPALPPALPGLTVEVKDEALFVNERRIEFGRKPLSYRRVHEHFRGTLVPLVGGWRHLAEAESLAEKDAVARMRSLADELRGKTASIVLRPESVAWTEGEVLMAYCAGRLLGSVPQERTDEMIEFAFEPVDAILSFRGRTLYALLVA